MGAFVNFGPVLTSPPPVLCRDVVLWAFLLEADQTALTGLCQRVFKKNDTIEVRAIEKSVVLLFGDLGWVGNPNVNVGVTEKQVLIHIFVHYKVGSASGYAYFTPYIWVDNPLSMAGGREVWGYPKGLGKLCVPRQASSTGLKLALQTWRGGLDKGGVWQPDQNQIVVEQQGVLQPSPVHVLNLWMNQLTCDASKKLLKDQLIGRTTEIFLRQFLDVGSSINSPTTCFQQILTAEYVPDNSKSLEPALFSNKFSLTMADFYSAPMVTDLSPRNLSAVPKQPNIFRTTLEGCARVALPGGFTLQNPTVLWPKMKAASARQASRPKRGRSRQHVNNSRFAGTT
jgi:hypothetical protein